MTALRSPRGLALTVLATLAAVVSALLGVGALELWTSRPYGLEGGAEASWVRGGAVALAALGLGLVVWAALALASYAVRLTGWRLVAVAALLAAGALHAYRAWSWAPSSVGRYAPASLVGPVPNDVLGTTWRGVEIGCGGAVVVELRIEVDGRVVRRQWAAPSGVFVPLLHALRTAPPSEPYVSTGRLVDGVVTWDGYRWDGDYAEALRREGDRIVLDWISTQEVTPAPSPAP